MQRSWGFVLQEAKKARLNLRWYIIGRRRALFHSALCKQRNVFLMEHQKPHVTADKARPLRAGRVRHMAEFDGGAIVLAFNWVRYSKVGHYVEKKLDLFEWKSHQEFHVLPEYGRCYYTRECDCGSKWVWGHTFSAGGFMISCWIVYSEPHYETIHIPLK